MGARVISTIKVLEMKKLTISFRISVVIVLALFLYWIWIMLPPKVIETGGFFIIWLGENEKFAGWAQLAATLLIVSSAFCIPLWQHRVQKERLQTDLAERSFSLSAASYYLVLDIRSHLRTYVSSADLSVGLFKDDYATKELMKRIDMLEQRETNVSRMFALTHARRALWATHQFLAKCNQQNPPSQEVVELIVYFWDSMEDVAKIAEIKYKEDQALCLLTESSLMDIFGGELDKVVNYREKLEMVEEMRETRMKKRVLRNGISRVPPSEA